MTCTNQAHSVCSPGVTTWHFCCHAPLLDLLPCLGRQNSTTHRPLIRYVPTADVRFASSSHSCVVITANPTTYLHTTHAEFGSNSQDQTQNTLITLALNLQIHQTHDNVWSVTVTKQNSDLIHFLHNLHHSKNASTQPNRTKDAPPTQFITVWCNNRRVTHIQSAL